MFGKCKGCVAKDKYIASLELQLRQWQKLVLPKNSLEEQAVDLEASAIFTGAHEVIDMGPTSDKIAQDKAVEDDFHKIITGA